MITLRRISLSLALALAAGVAAPAHAQAPLTAAHPQWSWLEGYLNDRPTQPWTEFSSGQGQ